MSWKKLRKKIIDKNSDFIDTESENRAEIIKEIFMQMMENWISEWLKENEEEILEWISKEIEQNKKMI